MYRYEYGKWLLKEGIKGTSVQSYTHPLTVAQRVLKDIDNEFENFTPSVRILNVFPPEDRQARSRLKKYCEFLEQFEPSDKIYAKKFVNLEFYEQSIAIPIKSNYTNPDNPEKWISGWDSLQVSDIIEILFQNEHVLNGNDSELQQVCNLIGKNEEIGFSSRHIMHLFEQLLIKLGRKQQQSQKKQSSIVDELQELVNLKMRDLLTENEFKLAKAKLLGDYYV